MKILILPGNSVVNKEWMNEIKTTLSKLENVGEIKTIEYLHWSEKEGIISLEKELRRIKGDYDIVIGRSAGIVLALKGIKEGKLKANKMIFMGTPIRWAEEKGFEPLKYFYDIQKPILFIQNKDDPTYSLEELKKLAEEKNINNTSYLEIEGDSHDYECSPKIIKRIRSFLGN